MFDSLNLRVFESADYVNYIGYRMVIVNKMDQVFWLDFSNEAEKITGLTMIQLIMNTCLSEFRGHENVKERSFKKFYIFTYI